jgi:hypothetical protein
MNKLNNEFARPILKSSSILTFQTKNFAFNDDNSVGVGLEDYMDAKFFDFNGNEIVWNLYGTNRVAGVFQRFHRLIKLLNILLLYIYIYIFISQDINIRDINDDKHYLVDFAEVFAHQ